MPPATNQAANPRPAGTYSQQNSERRFSRERPPIRRCPRHRNRASPIRTSWAAKWQGAMSPARPENAASRVMGYQRRRRKTACSPARDESRPAGSSLTRSGIAGTLSPCPAIPHCGRPTSRVSRRPYYRSRNTEPLIMQVYSGSENRLGRYHPSAGTGRYTGTVSFNTNATAHRYRAIPPCRCRLACAGQRKGGVVRLQQEDCHSDQ